jgi:hypothetical protein
MLPIIRVLFISIFVLYDRLEFIYICYNSLLMSNMLILNELKGHAWNISEGVKSRPRRDEYKGEWVTVYVYYVFVWVCACIRGDRLMVACSWLGGCEGWRKSHCQACEGRDRVCV